MCGAEEAWQQQAQPYSCVFAARHITACGFSSPYSLWIWREFRQILPSWRGFNGISNPSLCIYGWFFWILNCRDGFNLVALWFWGVWSVWLKSLYFSLCVGYGHLLVVLFFFFLCHLLPTGNTFSAAALCCFLSLPVPQVSKLYVLGTSILTHIVFSLAWFKWYIVQKLNLDGRAKPCCAITSRVHLKNLFAILH